MSEKPDPSPSAPTSDADAARLLARRRFTRAGLSAPIVLGTLASKPVLGQVPHNCTISGQMSGNLSRPGDVYCDTLGYSPEDWAGRSWESTRYLKDLSDANKNTCDFAPSTNQGTLFSEVFGSAFARASVGDNPNQTCSVIAYRFGQYPATARSATLLQVLRNTGTSDLERLGRQAVASLLNASEPGKSASYPFKPEQVVALFNEVWQSDGRYVHSTSPEIVLGFAGVLGYLGMINGGSDA